jgi:aminopeptidase N
MGDDQFLKMLGELARRKQFQSLTTEEFRAIAAEFLPPKSEDPKLEAFFEQWVYGTGIPSVKMQYTVSGKAPNWRVKGTVTQSDVDEDFSASVPVVVNTTGKRSIIRWIRTSSDPVPFSIDVNAAPVKVVLDPQRALLTRR